MKKNRVGSAISLVCLSSIVVTDSMAETAPGDGSWKGSVELGIVNTTGNTKTKTTNAKAKAETEREKWRHTLGFDSLTSSDHDTTTAERYAVNGQSNYKFGPQNYFFALLAYEDDRFSGYDYRVTEALGYGRRIIDNPELKLDLEIGPGARQSKLEGGGSEDELMVRGAANLAWDISRTSKFTENFSTEVGEDETITKSVTALSAQINGSLATKITYTIKNTSDVPAGVKKTDTETAVTLVYNF